PDVDAFDELGPLKRSDCSATAGCRRLTLDTPRGAVAGPTAPSRATPRRLSDTASAANTPTGNSTIADTSDATTPRASAGPGTTNISPAAESPTPSRLPGSQQVRAGRPATRAGTHDLLFTRQSPILSVETIGPRRITVGKPSTYELTVRNTGQVAADQVVVAVDLPTWTEVTGAEASKGTTGSAASGEAGKRLQWQVGRLEAKGSQKLALKIVPRESRPFDLAVRWDFTPAVSQAMIEVQEPRLDMRLHGPREVLFGKSEVYRLELTNSGTGDAENVEISMAPIGPGENVPATHKLGTLAAGEKKTIEVELTARHAGLLVIKVDAQDDSGVEAHVSEKITVHRPALDMAIQAPRIQYVGTNATWQIRVSNSGSAPATNVAVSATIPSGTEYVSNFGGGQLSADGSSLSWKLSRLDVGEEQSFDLTCKLARSGSSRLEVTSVAEGDLSVSKEAETIVEAMADLVLDLTDPPGPVALGAEATYQVRVQNRGTEDAEAVEVVVYFSHGIEPTAVDGGQHQIAPGQVLFDKIPTLAAGQGMTFQVRAKADKPGNYICRVEVHCKPVGARLVSEETTHFYDGARASREPASPPLGRTPSPWQRKEIRTAEQPRTLPSHSAAVEMN
ncbi:MAG: CARDB domain-containing protein, partial [Planctomycetota bacterium]